MKRYEGLIKDYRKEMERKLLPRIEKIQSEITTIKEEWEIMKNPKMVRKIEESIEQKKMGKLHSWKEFKKIIDGK